MMRHFMKIYLFTLSILTSSFLMQTMVASEEVADELDKATTAKQVSYLTYQEVKNRLSSGLFPSSKQRIQLALAPAAQEYLTEEFINLVQNFSQKMNIYEKCYVIRAVMKLPAAHLIPLSNLTTEYAQQLVYVPGTERVDFLKKLRDQEPSQWQTEMMQVTQKYQK